jgi:lanosterol synthase
MNILVSWLADGPSSEEFHRHLDRIPDFMWMSPEGMMMNGTNGSQLWDTAFAVQALTEAGIAEEEWARPYMLKALNFLDDCQIKHNMVDHEKYYRHVSKGAWPFSTREQTYTVSDCTAEGLKAIILMQNKLSYLPKLVSQERLQDAVDVLLTMQNADGGFASYEPIRGAKELEWLNPAEVFGNIMIEYSYPECTTAVLLGLTSFRKQYGAYRRNEIEYFYLYNNLARQLKRPLTTFATLNVKMEVGMAVGVSASLMRCFLRWKVFQTLGKVMRIVLG